jgi:hypothetical protein
MDRKPSSSTATPLSVVQLARQAIALAADRQLLQRGGVLRQALVGLGQTLPLRPLDVHQLHDHLPNEQEDNRLDKNDTQK